MTRAIKKIRQIIFDDVASMDPQIPVDFKSTPKFTSDGSDPIGVEREGWGRIQNVDETMFDRRVETIKADSELEKAAVAHQYIENLQKIQDHTISAAIMAYIDGQIPILKKEIEEYDKEIQRLQKIKEGNGKR